MSHGKVFIEIPELQHKKIIEHLLGPDGCEEAVFAFCKFERSGSRSRFELIDWYAVPPTGFVTRSRYFLELTDETRSQVIKRAHDLQATLIEFHSHRSTRPAAFSPSDYAGFDEFVPHVWWRLKGRPYAAVVVAESSFDGIAWIDDAKTAVPLSGISLGNELLLATGESHRESRNNDQ